MKIGIAICQSCRKPIKFEVKDGKITAVFKACKC